MLRFFFKSKVIHEIDEENKLIFQKFSGEVSSMSIIKSYKDIFNDKQYNPHYNWIVDARKSKQLFKSNEIDSFFSVFTKNASAFNGKKVAFVISTRHQAETINNMVEAFEAHHMDVKIKKFPENRTAFNWVTEK